MGGHHHAGGSNERLHYRGTGAGSPHFEVFFGGTVAGRRIVSVQAGGTTFAAVLADGFTATHDVAVQVAARPNLLTTGASDALVYECAVVVDGVWNMGQETGPAPSSTRMSTWAAARSGAAVTDQPLSTTTVRVSSRFHTMTEFGEDFVQSRNAGGTADSGGGRWRQSAQTASAMRASGLASPIRGGDGCSAQPTAPPVRPAVVRGIPQRTGPRRRRAHGQSGRVRRLHRIWTSCDGCPCRPARPIYRCISRLTTGQTQAAARLT